MRSGSSGVPPCRLGRPLEVCISPFPSNLSKGPRCVSLLARGGGGLALGGNTDGDGERNSRLVLLLLAVPEGGV
jgi:hypothetical protein